MKMFRTALALVVALGLTACGAPTTGMSLGSSSSQSADISKAESVQLDSLNDSGQLDELDDTALETLAADEESAPTDSYQTQGISTGLFGKGSTRCGYIRSSEDGKFFLQSKQGIFKRKDVSTPIVGKGENESLKLAKYLNDKVIVRGSTSGSTMTIKAVYRIPDFGVLFQLIKTGCIHGKVYNSKTLEALGGTDITLRRVENSRIYRTHTRKSGEYHIGFLPPGDYTLEATLAGFSKGTLAKITIAKRKSTPANLPLSAVAAVTQ